MADLTQAFSAKDRLRPDNVGTVSTGREVRTSVCGHHQSREAFPAAHRLSVGRLSQESYLEAAANYLSHEHYIKRWTDIQMGAETCCALIISSNRCFVGYPGKRIAMQSPNAHMLPERVANPHR
jgi:hypothetical protein